MSHAPETSKNEFFEVYGAWPKMLKVDPPKKKRLGPPLTFFWFKIKSFKKFFATTYDIYLFHLFGKYAITAGLGP